MRRSERIVPPKFAKELAPLTGDDIRVQARGQKAVPIRKSMVGKVLGKEHATLKSIKKKTGARVVVRRRARRNPKVEITGEPSQVESAEKLIDNIIGPRGKTIKVNKMHLGTLIGADGQHIQQIHDATGARINIPSKDCQPSGNGDISVVISGTKEQIQNAEERIMKLFNNISRKYEEQMRLHTEIHTIGCKVYLKQIDKSIKASDLLKLYLESPKPKIVIRLTKAGDGKYATCTLANAALATSFMEQLQDTVLGSRRIVCKE